MGTASRIAAAVAGALLLVACGGDDGADVRSTGTSSGSGSGSAHASGHATGHASGSASGQASGTEVAECAPVGGALADEATAEVEVTLAEWSVRPARHSVKRGVVAFDLINEGEDEHEFVIARADSAEQLPLADDGTVDLESLGNDFIGEVGAFPPGEDCSGTFELARGNYVLLCNLLHEEDGDAEKHFELGMHTEFSVE